MKFFDYKFMIMLGLTMVVYFLYREIDTLNKRVSALEKTPNTGDNIEEADDATLPLPLPPTPKKNKPVETYSNDMIYSNDMMDSNTNQQDTMMVESLVEMTNNNLDTSTSEEEIFVENDISDSECDDNSSVVNNKLDVSPKKGVSPISPKSSISHVSSKSPVLAKSPIVIKSDDNLDNLLKNKLGELQEINTRR